MKYILDFDGVIFNTEALKKVMVELGIEAKDRSSDMFAQIRERKGGDFDFTQFVFKDALAFLEAHKGECVVVSSYQSINPDNNKSLSDEVQKQYQVAKIASSGIGDIIGSQNIHIVGISKKEKLAQLQRTYTDLCEAFCFVDDREVYVTEALSLGIRAYFMNSEEKRGSGIEGYIHSEKMKNEIRSFVDFEKHIETNREDL